jgi:hypothetical protein
MGLFDRIKALARLDAAPTEEPSRELGDLIEPGSVEVSGMSAGGAGGAAGLDQLKELQTAGLIDADTLKTIESTMVDATAQLEQLHASGMMSDEVYAQAMASMAAATSGSGAPVDAAELHLLQHGESAAATVLAGPDPTDPPCTRLGMKLEVHPAAGSPYPVDCTIAARHPGGDLKVGDFLRVKVDPEDPMRVAVDWTGFGDP